MSNRLSILTRLVAGFVIAVCSSPSSGADDDTEMRRDEARLAIMEEHVEEIALNAAEIAKLSADARPDARRLASAVARNRISLEAIDAIVTDYFLATRIKPAAADDEPAIGQYLRSISLLNEIIVQTHQARTGDAVEVAQKLTSLIEQFRAAITKTAGSVENTEDKPNAKQDEPNKAAGADKQDKTGFKVSEAELLLFKMVNAYRKKQGLEPLQLDEKLCYAARDHSVDMNMHKFFSHQSPVAGRTRFTDRAEKRGSTASAENIARDCKDARMAMKLWVNSQHHRANITGSHNRIGVGIDAKGFYTQVFGK